MIDFFTDYTVQLVVVGSAITGATSGALGCFAYLRKQGLIGDVISHSALLGIVPSEGAPKLTRSATIVLIGWISVSPCQPFRPGYLTVTP